jgi:hypothetical protein
MNKNIHSEERRSITHQRRYVNDSILESNGPTNERYTANNMTIANVPKSSAKMTDMERRKKNYSMIENPLKQNSFGYNIVNDQVNLQLSPKLFDNQSFTGSNTTHNA